MRERERRLAACNTLAMPSSTTDDSTGQGLSGTPRGKKSVGETSLPARGAEPRAASLLLDVDEEEGPRDEPQGEHGARADGDQAAAGRARVLVDGHLGLDGLCGNQSSSALQFVVSRGPRDVLLAQLGRLYQRDVVSEFGPKTWPRCRDSDNLTHWLISTQAGRPPRHHHDEPRLRGPYGAARQLAGLF